MFRLAQRQVFIEAKKDYPVAEIGARERRNGTPATSMSLQSTFTLHVSVRRWTRHAGERLMSVREPVEPAASPVGPRTSGRYISGDDIECVLDLLAECKNLTLSRRRFVTASRLIRELGGDVDWTGESTLVQLS